MERSRSDIDRCVHHLDRRNLDGIAAAEAERDLRSLAWREMVSQPAGRALRALWRAVTAHRAMPSRDSRERSSS